MKNSLYSLAAIVTLQAACHGQQAHTWNLVVNSEGATILTCPSAVETPNGPHSGILVLTKSGGGVNAYFSLDFKVAGVSKVKDFHFDDFEGPEMRITTKLMSLERVSNEGMHESYSFLPNGGFVSEPVDGFVFGTMEKGKKNQFVAFISRAAASGGIMVVRVSDSVNPKHQLTASFDLDAGRAKLQQFLASK